MYEAYIKLYSDNGFNDMKTDYSVNYETSQLTGFNNIKACFKIDGTRVLKLV